MLDAAALPATFALPPSLVLSIMAGGPNALGKAVPGMANSARDADQRMRRAAVGPADFVLAVTTDGDSPFIRAALDYAKFRRAQTLLLALGHGPETTRTIDTFQSEGLADLAIGVCPPRRCPRTGKHLSTASAAKAAVEAITIGAFVHLGKTYNDLMVDIRAVSAESTPEAWDQAIAVLRELRG